MNCAIRLLWFHVVNWSPVLNNHLSDEHQICTCRLAEMARAISLIYLSTDLQYQHRTDKTCLTYLSQIY